MWIEGEQKKVEIWANSLSSLHPFIEGDMPFVLEGLKKEVEIRLADSEELYRQFRGKLEGVVKVDDPVLIAAPAELRVESPRITKRNYNDDSASPTPQGRKKGTLKYPVRGARGRTVDVGVSEGLVFHG